MGYEFIKDFRRGLDARKFFLSQPAGSLTTLINAHITQGGEIEKRKSFVPITIPAAFSGIHFGMQPGTNGIFIFGSYVFPAASTANRSRTSNVATLLVSTAGTRGLQTGDVVNISGIGGTGYNGTGITLLSATSSAGSGTRSQTITYASVGSNEGVTVDSGGRIILQVTTQLPAPFIYAVLPSPNWSDVGTGPNITEVLSSTLFSGQPFVLAKFDDGTTFPYYGTPGNVELLQGVTVPNAIEPLFDSYTGLQLALYTTEDSNVGHSGEFILKNLAFYMNNLPVTNYTNTWAPAALNFDIKSIPTTLNGTPFVLTDTLVSAAATLAVAEQSTGSAAVAPTNASGSFQIVGGDSGTQAIGTVSAISAQPADGETVNIGGTLYRFKNTPAIPNDVQIKGDRWKTMASFAAAINGTGTAGTSGTFDYWSGTVKNTLAYCYALQAQGTSGSAIVFIAAIAGGTAGNSVVLTNPSHTNITVSGSGTLTGAVASQITQIVVNGSSNLLSGAVAFLTDIPTTVAAIVANINANVSSGFSAIANNNTVTIFPQVEIAATTTLSSPFTAGGNVSVLAVTSAAGIQTGQLVSGVGIPTGVSVTGVSGTNISVTPFSATANSNGSYIFVVNGYSIQVQSQGTLVVDSGAFTITGSGFTLDFCQVNGVDLMNDTGANNYPALPSGLNVLTYPFVSNPIEAGATAFTQVLSDFCRAVANNINSLTSTNGYIAFCAQGSVSLFIGKATSTSTDKQAVLNISVTAAVGQTGAVIPVTTTPLSANVSTNVVAIPVGKRSSPVTCNVSGGVAPYTYSWVQQSQNVASVIANNRKSAQTTFSGGFGDNASIQKQLNQYNAIKKTEGQAAAQTYLNAHPSLNAYLQALANNQIQFACVVTDALGEVATSDSVFITLLGIQQ